MMSLKLLNLADKNTFVAICGGFFEHSPWIAEQAWENRPFVSPTQLHETMCRILKESTIEDQLTLIRAHPDLVGRLAREGRLTAQSTGEQAAAGLNNLTIAEADAFDRYNAAYRERFSFPFVICARENRKESILKAFPIRLENGRETEITTALTEIYKIAKLRIADAISED